MAMRISGRSYASLCSYARVSWDLSSATIVPVPRRLGASGLSRVSLRLPEHSARSRSSTGPVDPHLPAAFAVLLSFCRASQHQVLSSLSFSRRSTRSSFRLLSVSRFHPLSDPCFRIPTFAI